MSDAALLRIAAALERLSPPPPPEADPAAHPAYVWHDGVLTAARAFRPLPLHLLAGVDRQKAAALENARRLDRGLPAHDVLLWGARGSGKSSLVKSVAGALQADGASLALVEVAPDALPTLPRLFARIADTGRAWIVFVDDLGFDAGAQAVRQVRSLLEGGAEARPANARLHVTTNRRNIVPRAFADEPDAVNARDVADDALALADRFGLSLGFHMVGQPDYLTIVEGYACAYALPFDPADAIAFATARGARSGRVAWHYVVELAGSKGRVL